MLDQHPMLALNGTKGAHMHLSHPVSMAEGNRILRMRALSQKLQISSSRIYALVAEGKFLKPFQLVPGGRAVGWLEADEDSWLLERRGNQDKLVRPEVTSEAEDDSQIS
jgi:prophage regulatory protein